MRLPIVCELNSVGNGYVELLMYNSSFFLLVQENRAALHLSLSPSAFLLPLLSHRKRYQLLTKKKNTS